MTSQCVPGGDATLFERNAKSVHPIPPRELGNPDAPIDWTGGGGGGGRSDWKQNDKSPEVSVPPSPTISGRAATTSPHVPCGVHKRRRTRRTARKRGVFVASNAGGGGVFRISSGEKRVGETELIASDKNHCRANPRCLRKRTRRNRKSFVPPYIKTSSSRTAIYRIVPIGYRIRWITSTDEMSSEKSFTASCRRVRRGLLRTAVLVDNRWVVISFNFLYNRTRFLLRAGIKERKSLFNDARTVYIIGSIPLTVDTEYGRVG